MSERSSNPLTRVAIRPGYRVELVRGAREGQEPVAGIDLTALFALDGAYPVQAGAWTGTLAAPAVCIVPSGTGLGIGASDTGTLMVLTLKAALLVESARRLGSDDHGNVVFEGVRAALGGSLELSARRLALAIETATPARERALDLAVHAVATDLVDAFGRTERSSRLETSRAGLVDRRLRRSIEFMHDNYDRDIPLGDIAAAAFLSEFHFARLFKRITGQTPHAYLANLRIDKARELLAETDLTVGEVGARVGYQSPSHFGKVFRQATGITPTAFRDAIVR